MSQLAALWLTILIVWVVTSGLKIKFDRFFAILMLLFLFKFTIFDSIYVFLWIIFFGALMILLHNKDKIVAMPKKMKLKRFTIIPLLTFVFSGLWVYVLRLSSANVIIIILWVLAILYWLRLAFIHFKTNEMDYKDPKPNFVKLCSMLWPVISWFAIWLFGTSLKPLKIPFAVKLWKMNIKQVYIWNTITTLFASLFTIWRYQLFNNHLTINFYTALILWAALWTGIHYMSELTDLVFPEKWRKWFQILIWIILILVSVKIFTLVNVSIR